jgi:hypothetical protein
MIYKKQCLAASRPLSIGIIISFASMTLFFSTAKKLVVDLNLQAGPARKLPCRPSING